jgi:hypothetical protein
VRKSKLLPDSAYDQELERLSGLPKFPALPKAQQELRHALRRISESDVSFIHRLISDVVDTHTVCPTPADLIQMAGAKRHRVRQTLGNPDCELCGGSGFASFTRQVTLPGIAPYESEFAARCECRK